MGSALPFDVQGGELQIDVQLGCDDDPADVRRHWRPCASPSDDNLDHKKCQSPHPKSHDRITRTDTAVTLRIFIMLKLPHWQIELHCL
jgi:hypothetical protein